MATCRGCGRHLVWGTTPEGKHIPLDAEAHYYRIEREDAVGDVHVRRVTPEEGRVLVSHFQTCPKANQFSGSQKRT